MQAREERFRTSEGVRPAESPRRRQRARGASPGKAQAPTKRKRRAATESDIRAACSRRPRKTRTRITPRRPALEDGDRAGFQPAEPPAAGTRDRAAPATREYRTTPVERVGGLRIRIVRTAAPQRTPVETRSRFESRRECTKAGRKWRKPAAVRAGASRAGPATL
jgi:hypothetical protein